MPTLNTAARTVTLAGGTYEIHPHDMRDLDGKPADGWKLVAVHLLKTGGYVTACDEITLRLIRKVEK